MACIRRNMAYTIVVDNRERSLVATLRSISMTYDRMTVEVRPLDVGDVEVRAGEQLLLVVERKTWADLSSSICDGRWAEQKRRLVDTVGAERVAYVIEGGELPWGALGPVAPLPSASACMASTYAFVDDDAIDDGHAQLPVAEHLPPVAAQLPVVAQHGHGRGGAEMQPRVRGAMLSLAIGSSRLPVVRTRDVSDTAAFLMRAAEFLSSDKDSSGSSGGYAGAACRAAAAAFPKKRDNVDARQCYLQQLCQVPGISYAIATGIADTPGLESTRAFARTIESLPDAKARLASLQRAPKVGRAIAERLLALGGWS